MEAGDDEGTGQKIDPATYSPKNLAKELRKRRRLPLAECIELRLHLTEALNYLHSNQLIHRDVKPANIIFVGGIPKIADIALVTDIGGQGKDVTYLGTAGYIAPEGPGTRRRLF
jgi:serine/threonine protein kinase